jgi:hypothetical protein
MMEDKGMLLADAPSAPTSSFGYASFFVHGGERSLLQAIQWVEDHRPIPSISVWWVVVEGALQPAFISSTAAA